uniref:Glycosyltransferase n=1 Tax=viral metagenome TaxID=1070528 RepID=A0A6C0HD86_9ZZZZ
MSYGFIITRHVNSEITNHYWNHCIQCIRRFYSSEKYKIVVIDDNSNKEFLKSYSDYENVDYVESEFPGRGELLPYYYFYKNHYFENAVIIHDSVFFQTRINFSKLNFPVLPLWHFTEYKTENLQNTLSLITSLINNYHIQKLLVTIKNKYENLSPFSSDIDWVGCFGVQSYINHKFLTKLQNKYALFNLLKVVKNRKDRCCLERIMGTIFYIEFNQLSKIKSLLGSINLYCRWEYSWKEYWAEIQKRKKPRKPLIKVWTGR